MTIWHLVAVAGLILIGAATALRLLTGADTDQTTVLPALWDDTEQFWLPQPLDQPDPDGWSSHVGWSAWERWLHVRAEAWLDAEPLLFDALHTEWAERLAIEPVRELTAA